MLRQVCAIVFPFLTFSYASRVLGVEKIGMYTFGQSVISCFVCLAASGIGDYAVREAAAVHDDPKKLGQFANEMFTLQLWFTLISYVLLLLLLKIWGRLDPYRYVLLIQSMQMVLSVIGADWINTACGDFLYLSVRYLLTASVCTAALFCFVRGPEDLYIYTFFSMLCTSGGNLWNVFYIRRYVKLRPVLRIQLKKHLPPVLMLFGNSIALTVYLNADLTILGLLLDDTAVGIYAAAAKIYLMAKAVVNALIMAAVPKLSWLAAADRKESCSRMLSELADILWMILVPAAVGIFFEAENLIAFAAGSGYESGAVVLRIFSIALLPAVGSCLVSYAVLVPFHLERYFLLSTVLAAGLNMGLNIWLIPHGGITAAAFTTLLAEAFVFLSASCYAGKADGVRILVNRKDLCTDLAAGAAVAAICMLVKQAGLADIPELAVSVVCAAVVYGAGLAAGKSRTFLGLAQSVWKGRRSGYKRKERR